MSRLCGEVQDYLRQHVDGRSHRPQGIEDAAGCGARQLGGCDGDGALKSGGCEVVWGYGECLGHGNPAGPRFIEHFES